MGGQIEIRAVFPDGDVHITQFQIGVWMICHAGAVA
jgi:hypothetical protein